MNMPDSQATTSPAPVATAAEAEALAAHYTEVMDTLIGILQQETDLVRVGRLSQAARLEQPKTELARLYIADTLRVRNSQPRFAELAPQAMAELARRHDGFRALLQLNLTVLATAHAVSEGIVRGVSGELARQSSPRTYGPTGRTAAPASHAAPPLALSRML
jgi:hypothetical protein